MRDDGIVNWVREASRGGPGGFIQAAPSPSIEIDLQRDISILCRRYLQVCRPTSLLNIIQNKKLNL